MRAMLAHRRHQGLGMGGAHVFVDIQTIGGAAYWDDFGTQFVKHLGRDLVGRTVRAIDHYFEALERQVWRKRALAKLDIAARRIVQTFGFAQVA